MWKCVWGVGKCAWGGRGVERMLGWGWEKGRWGVRESVGRRMVTRPWTPTLLTPLQTLPIPTPPPRSKPHDPDPPTPISPTSTRPQPSRLRLPQPQLPRPQLPTPIPPNQTPRTCVFWPQRAFSLLVNCGLNARFVEYLEETKLEFFQT